MPAVPRSWEPANDVERTLRYAWDRDDTALYLRTLAHAPLYLPGFRARQAGEQGQPILTRRRGDRTYLLVCTSPEALWEATGKAIDGWHLTSLAELILAWPDRDWGMVVSPTTPIGAYLGYDEVDAMADLVRDQPIFHPASAAEAVMFRAQQSSDPGTYLDVLVLSKLVVPLTAPATPDSLGEPDFPWRVDPVDGLPAIVAVTSPERLAEAIAEPVPTVVVDFVALARVWPDPAYRLAVNPGSGIASNFAGEQVPDLLDWAGEVLARELTHGQVQPPPAAPVEPERAAGAPALEIVLDPADVDRYLKDGYDRVSGVPRPEGTEPVPVNGYLVRWHPDAGTADDPGTVRDWAVPSGAQLYQVSGGRRSLLATYQVELHRWVPAVADLLRGLTS